jgi:hypothetical protein
MAFRPVVLLVDRIVFIIRAESYGTPEHRSRACYFFQIKHTLPFSTLHGDESQVRRLLLYLLSM